MENVALVLSALLGVFVLITGLLLLRGALRRGQATERRFNEMATILADLKETTAKAEAARDRIEADVQVLRDRVAELEASAANRELDPEEKAELTALNDLLDGLDPTLPATLGKRKKSKS